MPDSGDRSDYDLGDGTNYTKRVVGFVDILGFGEEARKADADVVRLKKLLKALQVVHAVLYNAGEVDLRSQNFSDSLILSASNTCAGFWTLLMQIKNLALQMLELGLLIRGGVTIGNILHDNQIIFGVGVNEAYRLESTVARYPRVVLSKAAIQAASQYAEAENNARRMRASWLERDEDGVNHLQYFADFKTSAQIGRPDQRLIDIGERIQSVIQTKMDETVENPAIYEKIRWLALNWNSFAIVEVSPGKRPFKPVDLPGHANFENRRWLDQSGASGR